MLLTCSRDASLDADDEVWTEVEARHDFKVSVEAQLGLALYVLFGFLWAIQLCKAISWTSMSSAVCYWFVADSAKGGQCGKTGTGALRLLDATWTILSKHRAPATTAPTPD